ncbi:SPOC like C-terminal domain-containing protein [Gorgonomyces haynaldii]|nr:SPOC like C-terminal domain-containing protein [Gorgonomyces haynaldii]
MVPSNSSSTLFLVDGSLPPRLLQQIVQTIHDFVALRLINCSQSKLSIAVFSSHTKSSHVVEHLHELCTHQHPSTALLSDIKSLSQDPIGSTTDMTRLLDWVLESIESYRTVILITNSPVNVIQVERVRSKTHLELFSTLPLPFGDYHLLQEPYDALQHILKHQQQTIVFKTNLILGPGLQTKMNGFYITRDSKIPNLTLVESKLSQVPRADEWEFVPEYDVLSDMADDRVEKKLQDRATFGYSVTDTMIKFTGAEIQQMRQISGGLVLFGFQHKDALKVEHSIGRNYYLIPEQADDKVFSNLHEAMIRSGKVGFGQLVNKENASPRLVCLVPQKPETNIYGQILNRGFQCILLPFEDDKRAPPFQKVVPQDEDIRKAIALVKCMKVDASVLKQTHPHWLTIKSLLNNQEIPAQNDQPRVETQILNEFLAIGGVSPSKRRDHPEPKSLDDIIKLHSMGMLGVLKIPEMRAFLTDRGQKVTSRLKPVILNQLTEYILSL